MGAKMKKGTQKELQLFPAGHQVEHSVQYDENEINLIRMFNY